MRGTKGGMEILFFFFLPLLSILEDVNGLGVKVKGG